MNRETLNRALVLSESWSETLLLWVVGLPKPLTAIATAIPVGCTLYVLYKLLV